MKEENHDTYYTSPHAITQLAAEHSSEVHMGMIS